MELTFQYAEEAGYIERKSLILHPGERRLRNASIKRVILVMSIVALSALCIVYRRWGGISPASINFRRVGTTFWGEFEEEYPLQYSASRNDWYKFETELEQFLQKEYGQQFNEDIPLGQEEQFQHFVANRFIAAPFMQLDTTAQKHEANELEQFLEKEYGQQLNEGTSSDQEKELNNFISKRFVAPPVRRVDTTAHNAHELEQSLEKENGQQLNKYIPSDQEEDLNNLIEKRFIAAPVLQVDTELAANELTQFLKKEYVQQLSDDIPSDQEEELNNFIAKRFIAPPVLRVDTTAHNELAAHASEQLPEEEKGQQLNKDIPSDQEEELNNFIEKRYAAPVVQVDTELAANELAQFLTKEYEQQLNDDIPSDQEEALNNFIAKRFIAPPVLRVDTTAHNELAAHELEQFLEKEYGQQLNKDIPSNQEQELNNFIAKRFIAAPVLQIDTTAHGHDELDPNELQQLIEKEYWQELNINIPSDQKEELNNFIAKRFIAAPVLRVDTTSRAVLDSNPSPFVPAGVNFLP